MGTKLRLVGAKRYVDTRIRVGAAVEFGEIVEIEDEALADAILQVTFLDKYNEASPMFEEVEEVEEEEDVKPKTRKVVRAVKTSRKRKASSIS